MRPTTFRSLIVLGLLLSFPLPGHAFDLEFVLKGLGLMLLMVLAGIAVIIAALIATGKLLRQLWQPEATNLSHGWAAKLRIAGLTLPATAVVWVLPAWLTYDPKGSWYYPAVPLTLLLGALGCLLLRWRRPTAAKAMLAGLLVAGTVATRGYWLAQPARKPPVPLGLLGNPVFKEASFPATPVMSADTSHVYTYVDRMPGFQGTGTALKKLVNNELHYPNLARDRGISGVVQITFTVQPTGGLSRIHVTQSLSAECDAEALRVVKLLAPYFSAGSQNGELVAVQESLSFGFGPTAIPNRPVPAGHP